MAIHDKHLEAAIDFLDKRAGRYAKLVEAPHTRQYRYPGLMATGLARAFVRVEQARQRTNRFVAWLRRRPNHAFDPKGLALAWHELDRLSKVSTLPLEDQRVAWRHADDLARVLDEHGPRGWRQLAGRKSRSMTGVG